MRTTTLQLFILVASLTGTTSFLAGCSKSNSGSNNNNNTTPAFTYQVNNIGDVSVPVGGSTAVPWEVKLLTGAQQSVTLSVSGLPTGITAALAPATGTATFTSAVTFSVGSSVATGTYPFTVKATSAGVSDKTYTSNVIVAAPVTCSAERTGNYSGSDACQSGNYTYTSVVTEATGTTNRINISNPGGFGAAIVIYANLNCANQTLTIPTQNISAGRTISGNGTFTANQIVYTYTVTDALGSDLCTATLTK